MGSFFLTILTFSSLIIFSSGSTLTKLSQKVKGGVSGPTYACYSPAGNYPWEGDCNYFLSCDGAGHGSQMECAYCDSPFNPYCCGGQLCYDAITRECDYCTEADCDACYDIQRNVTALH